MHHQKVNVAELTRRLKRAAGAKPYAEIARSARIDPDRVTKFLNGNFKALTPVLASLCANLGISPQKFLLKSPPSALSEEMLTPLRRIVGSDAKKIKAATRLLRSLEALTVGGRHPGGTERKT